MIPFEYGPLRLNVRSGAMYRIDTEIVEEVQRSYFWDRFDPLAVRTAVDVGGHIGSWSLYLKHLNPEVRIAIVEVEEDNLRTIAENIRGIDDINLYHARAGYEQGDFVLGRHSFNGGAHAIYPRAHMEQILEIDPYRTFVDPPDMYTLEDVMRHSNFEQIDLLKLDCEGAEDQIIRQMEGTTLAGISRIVGEIHSVPAVFESNTHWRLQNAGFQIEYVPHPAHPVLHTFMAWR